MKAITLWQPWGSLLTCGAKEFETRSWATSYRGPIAIHAAARPIQWDSWLFEPGFTRALYAALPQLRDVSELPRGCIIATAELVGCHKMVRHGGRGLSSDSPGWLETDDGRYYEPTEQELLFGDWTPGRFAWEFVNVKLLSEPIPAKGGQRIWNWTPPTTFESSSTA